GYTNTFQGIPQLLRALPLLQAVPGAVPAAAAVSRLLPSRHYWAKARDAMARPASPASAYPARRGPVSPAEVRSLVMPEVWEAAAESFDPVRHIAERGGTPGAASGLFSWISRAELAVYTHHQLLADTDRMSMAHSLEVR